MARSPVQEMDKVWYCPVEALCKGRVIGGLEAAWE
jgi:hypothetical protein